MTTSFIDNRNIVPRWRRAAETRQLHELDPLGAAPPAGLAGDDVVASTQLEDALVRWRRGRTPGAAREVVSAALVAGVPAADLDGATEATFDAPDCSPLARAVSGRLLGRAEPDSADSVPELAGHDELSKVRLRWRARQLKERIRRCPSNVIPWVDLGWVQLNLGQPEPAERALRYAVAIAPDSRFALRSAARLLVHLRRGREAHELLLRSERTTEDPWLLAAELGVADFAGLAPRGVRRARQLLDRRGVDPWHLSELAGALATLELRADAHRKARELFRLALRHPNENVLAQAEWASEQDPRVVGLPIDLTDGRAHEAAALKAYAEGQFDVACREAIAWQQDQPFDRDAAELASFCASTYLREYSLAARLAKLGLRSNPGDLGLVNNLAYALAHAGRIDDAGVVLAAVDGQVLSDVDAAPLLATRGLLAYRSGNIDRARVLYQEACDASERLGFFSYIGFATICRAEEEIRLGTSEARDFAVSALQRIDELGLHARRDPVIASRVIGLERFISRSSS